MEKNLSEESIQSKPQTRNIGYIFGFGQKVTIDDSEITGIRLPTTEQVLRCFRFHQIQGLSERKTKRDIAKIILEKIKPFYDKGNIPMISEKGACDKFISYVDRNAHLRKTPIKRRSTPSVKAKLEKQSEDFKKTFPLWPENAEQIIKIQEDVLFSISMKTDRIATFACRDKLLSQQVQRKQKGALEELDRSDRHKRHNDTVELIGSDGEGQGYISQAAPELHSRCHKRTSYPGTTAYVPHNILNSPIIVSLATRMKISPSQQAAFTKAIIEESSGDASKVAISYASSDRARRSGASKIASNVKQLWMPPLIGSLHWDAKINNSLTNQYVSEDRLSICVGDSEGVKLLGTTKYPPGQDCRAGDIISEHIIDLLNSWNCANCIVNMVFDTTSSNTGHVSAGCIMIQQSLNRALLWSGCRHHVGELIIGHVFSDLNVEASKSPDVSVFKRFRDNFDKISHSGPNIQLQLFDINSFSKEAQLFIHDWKADALKTADITSKYQREDYAEFAELVKLYLGNGESDVKFRRPGAIHKARWMSKFLYALKMVILETEIDHLPRGTINTVQQPPKIRQFVYFVVLVYFNWWATCSCVSDAPINDLNFLKCIINYIKISSVVSKAAEMAFRRHVWYLNAEFVPLALFSNKVDGNELRQLAEKMLKVKPSDEVLQTPTNRIRKT